MWAVLEDVAQYPSWAPTFERVELPAGTTLAEGLPVKLWVRGAPTSTWRVTAFEPGRRFAWDTRARGVYTVADHVIVPSGDGTQLTLSVEMTGLMAKLFASRIRNVATRNVVLEGNALKARVESGG